MSLSKRILDSWLSILRMSHAIVSERCSAKIQVKTYVNIPSGKYIYVHKYVYICVYTYLCKMDENRSYAGLT